MTDQPNKPALDEQTFEKLLEAAYVMQEHNRKLRVLEASLEAQSEQLREEELAKQALLKRVKPAAEERSKADADYTLTLAQIVESQHQIQMRHLGLDMAMSVVAERVARITGASGAGIGLLEGGTVRYRAGAGPPALPVGTEVPLLKAVCQANIRTGQVIRTPDVDTEFLFDPDPCKHRGIRSLVAVPIHYDGNIVGALELYFDGLQGFAEQDIHTCQLMAGLVTEAIGRDAESKSRRSVSDERSAIVGEIERPQPNRAAEARSVLAGKKTAETTTAKSPCWKCGNNLLSQEVFCGKCGAPRSNDGEASRSTLQGKLAAAWQLQETVRDGRSASPSSGNHPPIRPALHSSVDDVTEALSLPKSEDDEFSPVTTRIKPAANVQSRPTAALDGDNPKATSTALVRAKNDDLIWTSAAKARDFLESLSATRERGALRRFWRSRRGDFYLAVAIILVVIVIRWGVWSDSSVVATGRGNTVYGSASHRRSSADADLTLFDRFLISLGLAEAPDETPQYKGNPDTQVWVDLHTALYYCPGSDLYGKTPKGKMSSQRDAQLDQFQPANRRACD